MVLHLNRYIPVPQTCGNGNEQKYNTIREVRKGPVWVYQCSNSILSKFVWGLHKIVLEFNAYVICVAKNGE